MDKVPRIPHLDTDESIERSLRESGVKEQLDRAIKELKAKRRAMGLTVDGYNRGTQSK